MDCNLKYNGGFTPETELLTEYGFKPIKDIETSESIAQFNSENFKVIFLAPTSITKCQYQGYMYRFNNETVRFSHIDGLFHHNQKIPRYFQKNDSRINERRVYESTWNSNAKAVISGLTEDHQWKLSDLDKLIIAIQAKGYVKADYDRSKSRAIFAQTVHEHKFEKFKTLLKKLDIKHTARKRSSPDNCYTLNFELFHDVDLFSIKTLDYFRLLDFDHSKAKEFLYELSYWRGTNDGEKLSYRSTNKKAIDKIQAVCALTNCYGHIRKPMIGAIKHKFYTIAIKTNCVKKSFKPAVEIDYDGDLYIVKASLGNIITRYNDKVMIVGSQ